MAEEVQISIRIVHPNPSNLEITIISPSGTQNIVLDRNSERPNSGTDAAPGANVEDLANVIFLSNAFYGERSQGTWTVKVRDLTSTEIGSVTNVKLKLFGHQ